jgi:TIR domain-containing protein
VAYEYEVFLSYRRAGEWPRFVNETFLRMFKFWLENELDDPRLFVDTEIIETGASWPRVLARGVATSKVMLCLWSRQYFASDWCLAELAQMLARRAAVAEQTGALPPLVLAAVIHDGEHISPDLGDIQRFEIQGLATPWLAPRTPDEQELSNRIRVLSGHVARAVEQAPAYDPEWTKLATEAFIDLYRRSTRQSLVPSLGGNRT